MASTRSLAGDIQFRGRRLVGPEPKAKAEGATAPETLRQKDRDRVMNFWKAKRPFWKRAASTEGVTRCRFISGKSLRSNDRGAAL